MRYELKDNTNFVDDYGRLPKGTIVYLNKGGQYHRLDGPAIVQPNGEEKWYQNGVLHRVGGPARYNTVGPKDELWVENGKIHREDGPAHVWGSHGKAYYYQGVCVIDDRDRVSIPPALDAHGPSFRDLQEFVIKVRPDLAGQFKLLDMDLARKYQYELGLSKVDL